MKEILLIVSLTLSAFGFNDALAGNPAVIYGANGLAKIIPANGLEFNGGETLSNTEVGQLKNIMLPFSAVLSDVAIATYFSVGVDQVSATNLDVTKRFEVISTTEASHSCPTMTEVQRDALTPIAGDCIYNSDSLSREYWDGVVWVLTRANGLPVMNKGSLFASSGISNGEFSACADGQYLEWDSAETSGIKCLTPPAQTPQVFPTSSTASWGSAFYNTNGSRTLISSMSITTTRPNQPILFSFSSSSTQFSTLIYSNATCDIFIKVAGTSRVRKRNSGSVLGTSPLVGGVYIAPSAGTHAITVTVDVFVSGGGSCDWSNASLTAVAL